MQWKFCDESHRVECWNKLHRTFLHINSHFILVDPISRSFDDMKLRLKSCFLCGCIFFIILTLCFMYLSSLTSASVTYKKLHRFYYLCLFWPYLPKYSCAAIVHLKQQSRGGGEFRYSKMKMMIFTHLVQGINLILFGWSLGSLDKACGGLCGSEWHLVQLAHLSHMRLISRNQKSLNFASKILSCWGRCLYPNSWAGFPLRVYTDTHSIYLRKVPLLPLSLAAAFICSVVFAVLEIKRSPEDCYSWIEYSL